MDFFAPHALRDLGAYTRATYEDTVTFQLDSGGRRSGSNWNDVAALSGLPASVTPVSADEAPEAGRYAGRQLYDVDLDADAEAGVTADAITAAMRVRVHARDGFAARFLPLTGPAEDVQRLGRWLRVRVVDEGATE
ncbi:MAG TPA: hypothetical protein VD838_12650 [Anaeromyxobacteraceae bacterium]|nr:hypothetical protein [Anaeromyxobacteraceae bacterium]